MSDAERQLLQRLASEGKATALSADEFLVAMFLETNGLVLIIRNTTDAIITPRGQAQARDHRNRRKAREEAFRLY